MTKVRNDDREKGELDAVSNDYSASKDYSASVAHAVNPLARTVHFFVKVSLCDLSSTELLVQSFFFR